MLVSQGVNRVKTWIRGLAMPGLILNFVFDVVIQYWPGWVGSQLFMKLSCSKYINVSQF